MTNKGNSRRALFMSLVSLLLCFTMLLGTTFAWFTDSVSSARNTIKSGNLDVVLEYSKWDETTKTWGSYTEVDANTLVFDDNALYEPGYTEVVKFKVTNAGSLALKYNLNVSIYSETEGTNKAGETFKLSDHLYVGTVDSITDRDTASAAATAKLGSGFAMKTNEKLEKTDDATEFVLVLTMPTSVGNEANHLNGKQPVIELGIDLFATQLTYETDSFDDQYDKDAPALYAVNGVAYASAEEALAAAKDGDKVILSVVDAPIVIDKSIELTLAAANIVAGDNENAITVNANATIVVDGLNTLYGGSNGDGILVAEGVTLNITGNGTLKTYGNTAKEYEIGGNYTSDATATHLAGKGGSGIAAVKATIVIDGLKNLVAEGYGVNGFGIGGNGSNVTINDTTVTSARGGFVNVTGNYNDASWNTSEPEGGAAIGGVSIAIDNSHIIEAIGGSKAAGIGARFWQPTAITITNSVIDKVVGGASSAGIGGSRVAEVTDGKSAQDVTINITDSTITAIGGYYGAGIGSGYDTHCSATGNAPMHTVNIKGDSVINATGGKYAAGIGTGYHVANLDGEIEPTVTVTAVSGEKVYKSKYTSAQDIGFGVVDPSREAKDNTSSLNYKGTEIGIPEVPGPAWDGTTVTPVTVADDGYYHITNGAELAYINTILTNGNVGSADGLGIKVILDKDIDLGNHSWTPIGLGTNSHPATGKDHAFEGTFDGNGHTISNINVDGTYESAGLFGFVKFSDTTVKNLTVKNVTVSGTSERVGAVAGLANGGAFINCDVIGAKLNAGEKVGGIVGDLCSASLTDCTVTDSEITSTAHAGALAGRARSDGAAPSVSNCTATNCIVTGVTGSVGELVGTQLVAVDLSNSSAVNCTVNAN